MSGIKKIAQLVGISPASVSIYLNDKSTNRVSAKTKLKIDEAVKELNYHKNVFASSLSTHESKLIGVIIPSVLPLFENEYTNALLSGAQSQFSAFGYGLLFFPSSAQSSIEIVQEQLERSAGCDGYILFSTGFCTRQQIRKNIIALQTTGKPFATLNIPEMEEDIRQVLIKDLDISTGTRYLLRKGHKEILLLLGRTGGVHAASLIADHEALMKSEGIPFNPKKILYGEYDADSAYEQIRRALTDHPDTTAICSMSDIMASAALLAAQDCGYRIPQDISIIGRNNSLHSRLCSPLLTTIDLHMQKAGQSAANLILDALSGNTVAHKILISGTILERESVKNLNQ
jgi:DNA-binding LacI/PurR family transcriptional regulator